MQAINDSVTLSIGLPFVFKTIFTVKILCIFVFIYLLKHLQHFLKYQNIYNSLTHIYTPLPDTTCIENDVGIQGREIC